MPFLLKTPNPMTGILRVTIRPSILLSGAMTNPIRIFLSLASLVTVLAGASTLRADVTITATQGGGKVTLVWSGSLTQGTPASTATNNPQKQVWPSQGGVGAWQVNAAANEYALNATVPFGTGGNSITALLSGVSSGTNFFLLGESLYIDQSYVSGTPFDTVLDLPGETFQNLGINTADAPYTWTVTDTGEKIILQFEDAPPTVTPDNSLQIAKLKRKLKKLQSTLRKLKGVAPRTKIARIKKLIRKVKKQIRALG